jgi:hypothetical protein
LSGVSPGGFLVPLVSISLGCGEHAAQAISLIAQLPPTGIGGVREYGRKGAAPPWQWTGLVAAGTLPGGALGAFGARLLSDGSLSGRAGVRGSLTKRR